MARSAVVCDVGRLGAADLAIVDALALLQLAAARAGADLRVRNASADLCRLLHLTGLAAVLSVEPGGQAEPREQPRVEEVVDVRDAAT